MKVRLLSLLILSFLSIPSLGAPPKPLELSGRELELKTQDGWTLKAKYLPAKPGERTFILLHGLGQRKEAWRRLARGLEKQGCGWLAPDLRGHGESAAGPDGKPAPWKKFKATKTENDFAAMTLDIQAAVSTLTARGVPEESIGVIGEGLGGSVGIKYAAVHPKVSLIVLLSPGMHYQEVLTPNAVRAYKDRPILMVYSELDRGSARDTPVLYAFAKLSAGEKNARVISVPNLRGNRMLNNSLVRQILDWLRSPVKQDMPAGSTATMISPVEESTGTAEEDLGPEPLPVNQ